MDNQRSLKEIAEEIILDWNHLRFYAQPYLIAMLTMDSIDDRYDADTAIVSCYPYEDKYGADTGTSIVTYFLCNASSWCGPTADRIKKELNGMLTATRLQRGGGR